MRRRHLTLAAVALLSVACQAAATQPPALPPGAPTATVDYVIDGDTIVLNGRHTRLIGIDTPELPDECGAQEARAALEQLAPAGTSLHVDVGQQSTDRYNRDLAYLWTDDGTFINTALVADGRARPLPIAPNTDHADLFDELADQARADNKGLWLCPVRSADS